MSVRLPTGQVTVLLGRGLARRQVMTRLDDTAGVQRVRAGEAEPVAVRLARLRDADAALVLVDRITDGLTAPERRTVLAGVRELALAGCAVLVDDIDPVAALAIADGGLRIDPVRGLVPEPVGDLEYLAS
jgi:hypothetical protein